MQCRPRGVRAAGYCARYPFLGRGKGRQKVFTCEEKSCTASPCIYASWKKTRRLLFFLPALKSEGRCIAKRGRRQKVPFAQPVIDVQEAPPRSLCCTGPLENGKNTELWGDAFPGRLFLTGKKVTQNAVMDRTGGHCSRKNTTNWAALPPRERQKHTSSGASPLEGLRVLSSRQARCSARY